MALIFCLPLFLLAFFVFDYLCFLLSPKHRPVLEESPADLPVQHFRPAPHRRTGGRPKPPDVVEKALELYIESGSFRTAATEIARLYVHEGITVGKSTVAAWWKKHSAKAKEIQRATRNVFPEHEPPNRRWCLDATGKADAHGTLHSILGIVDHGVRFNTLLLAMESAGAWMILSHLFAAIDRYGKPKIIRTDNAKVFHSMVFNAVLAAVGIRHEFTQVAHPWQNGRIERLFLTLKQKLNLVMPENREELNRWLSEFSFWYNEVRPHQHLHGLTPAEAWRGIDPYAIAPKFVSRFSGWNGLLRGFHIRR